MQNSTITIIGAGASGILCSILLARTGLKVHLIEQNSHIGKKIMASGNGKCNIANLNPTQDRYHSSEPYFVEQFLEGYDINQIRAEFDRLGIPTIEGNEGKLFPMSLQASSVVEILHYHLQTLGVMLSLNCKINSIVLEDGTFKLSSTSGIWQTKALLLATGSLAAPRLGGNPSGLDIARSLGHTITPTFPSLVQLCSDAQWVKHTSGVKIEAMVKLYANGEYITQVSGDILFTNYGISGLAILDISRSVNRELAEYAYCELWLDLLPNYTKEQLLHLLIQHTTQQTEKPLDIWLMGFINKKLVWIILATSQTKIKTTKELNRKELSKIAYAIKNLKLSIVKSRGYDGAEVMSGGVNTAEIDPKTMESKVVKNLYFAGELIDVDGDRGGFNFYFAWVSALRVAKALIQSKVS